MSYVIDLYLQKVRVQKDPVKLAFFISFFPQLIAGPIVRYIDIEKQIYERTESMEKFVSGAHRFIIGLGKKLVIANGMGYVTDLIFANSVTENTAATAWLGVICYAFQIYFDFSGYSDMAIGLGRMFGFEFLENFNYPYISKTLTEFWRRWHISLSSWFRDYVYIPLGGNKKGNVYVNLFIVFVLTGFWHGASFNFLVWGLWHGLFLVTERLFTAREVKNKNLVPLAHYNEIGAFFAYSELMKHINKYLPILIPIKMDDIKISYDKKEIPNVTLKSGFTYQRLDSSFFDDVNVLKPFTWENHAYVNVNSNLPIILILCDSYAAEGFIGKYLAQQFSKAIFIHYGNINNIQEYINNFKPDIVIFEAAERSLDGFANCVIGIPELQ
jgi:hypothetical protein